jgi:hypothetical protein
MSRVRLLILAALPLGLVVIPSPEETFFWNAVFDVGHALVFALIAWVSYDLSGRLIPSATKTRRFAYVVGLAVMLAGGTEFAQSFGGAHFTSMSDVLRDLSGTTIFLLLQMSRDAVRPSALRWALRLAALAIAVVIAFPVVSITREYAERDRGYPVLLRFDNATWEKKTLHVGRASLVGPEAARAADNSVPPGFARLDLRAGRFAGFVLDEPYPDWRGRQRLVFEVYSDQATPIRVRVRIHDRRHNGDFDDRYNREWLVGKERQTVAIPIEEIRTGPARRELDISRVDGIGVYALRLTAPARLYVGPFRLE